MLPEKVLCRQLFVFVCACEDQAAARLWREEVPTEASLSAMFFLAHGAHAAMDAPKKAWEGLVADCKTHGVSWETHCCLLRGGALREELELFVLAVGRRGEGGRGDGAAWFLEGFRRSSPRLPLIRADGRMNKPPRNLRKDHPRKAGPEPRGGKKMPRSRVKENT